MTQPPVDAPTPTPLKWTRHEDLAIVRRGAVGRREYLDHMTFAANRRPLFTEIFGPLIGLKEQWEAQGATPDELSFAAFTYRFHRPLHLPINCGALPGPPGCVLDEDDEQITYRDDLGRTMRMPKGRATLAMPLDYPVASADDWLKLRDRFTFHPDRLAGSWREAVSQAASEDRAVSLSAPGGFDLPRQLMGEAGACMAFIDQPELIADMLDTVARTFEQVMHAIGPELRIDILFIHEDMAGRSGPLIGPTHVREFLLPYYRRLWRTAQDHGAVLFDQDSDGDMRPVIDAFLDAGVNCMHPMEPAAGMNVVEIRRQYGQRLAFYGGIDKFALTRDRDAIDRELNAKLPTLIETGGCMLGLDHRIPETVPLDNYRYYIERMWDWIGRERPVASLTRRPRLPRPETLT